MPVLLLTVIDLVSGETGALTTLVVYLYWQNPSYMVERTPTPETVASNVGLNIAND